MTVKLRKSGFLHHSRRIKLEGTDIARLMDKCRKNDIHIRNLRWKGPLEVTFEMREKDLHKLKKAAGHSYRISYLDERGIIPVLKSIKVNIATIAGAFLLGALIFYQSMFIAEIKIDGYSSISETDIRQTLNEAGIYDGARKRGSYEDVKKLMYERFDKITWISIYENGRLLEVDIAEADDFENKKSSSKKPVNIVADRAGIIERVLPLNGNAKVQKGDYVNEGDVLISGRYKYQSTDYSRGDGYFYMYSHAEGKVLARVPGHLTYYLEKNERIKKPTGRFVAGIYLRIGDFEFDTLRSLNDYKVSVRKTKKIIDIAKPLPFALSFVRVNEVTLIEKPQDAKKVRRVIEAALRRYERENLKGEERILQSNIDLSEGVNTIRADVFTESLEEIGKEQIIKTKKRKDNINLTQ